MVVGLFSGEMSGIMYYIIPSFSKKGRTKKYSAFVSEDD